MLAHLGAWLLLYASACSDTPDHRIPYTDMATCERDRGAVQVTAGEPLGFPVEAACLPLDPEASGAEVRRFVCRYRADPLGEGWP